MAPLILAGDVGGTNTRLALFSLEGGRLHVRAEQRFLSRDHPGLGAVVRAFLDAHGERPKAACVGVAGPVREGRVQATNLPWVVDHAELARDLALGVVWVLNDLEANAWAIDVLVPEDLLVLAEGAAGARGNGAVIAAGTGLGEAGLYWDGNRHIPFAAEGGHASFSPCDELEMRLLVHLRARFGHVSWERLVSGPGLVNLYEFLRLELGGEGALAQESPEPAAITAAALDGSSALCSRVLDLFVRLYGAEAGNLALKMMATGGVFVGGGIAPRIASRLTDGAFVEAFRDKGRLRRLLDTIPVRVILNPDAALLGAGWCAVHRAGLLWGG